MWRGLAACSAASSQAYSRMRSPCTRAWVGCVWGGGVHGVRRPSQSALGSACATPPPPNRPPHTHTAPPPQTHTQPPAHVARQQPREALGVKVALEASHQAGAHLCQSALADAAGAAGWGGGRGVRVGSVTCPPTAAYLSSPPLPSHTTPHTPHTPGHAIRHDAHGNRQRALSLGAGTQAGVGARTLHEGVGWGWGGCVGVRVGGMGGDRMGGATCPALEPPLPLHAPPPHHPCLSPSTPHHPGRCD